MNTNMTLSMLVMLVIAIVSSILLYQYQNTADAKLKNWLLAGLAAGWIAAVLCIARWLCSFTSNVEQCFLAWSAAFGIGCLIAALEYALLRLGLPKRQLTENDKMKLQDI